MYTAIWGIECTRCTAHPVVGIENENGVSSTSLCGPCFFGDRTMLDPEMWNEAREDTE